jgi:cytochrome c5
MPARGGCFECRDEDLIGVYDWMMAEVKNVKSY